MTLAVSLRHKKRAAEVAAFSISADDSIVYSSGCGIFQLTPNGSATMVQDRVVEVVVFI